MIWEFQNLETPWIHPYKGPFERSIDSKSKGGRACSIHATQIVSRYVKNGSATLNDTFLDVLPESHKHAPVTIGNDAQITVGMYDLNFNWIELNRTKSA